MSTPDTGASAGDLADAPYPDRAHELLRQNLLDTIASTQDNTAGVDDAYYTTDILLDLTNRLLSTNGDLAQQVTALAQRVTALENASTS